MPPAQEKKLPLSKQNYRDLRHVITLERAQNPPKHNIFESHRHTPTLDR